MSDVIYKKPEILNELTVQGSKELINELDDNIYLCVEKIVKHKVNNTPLVIANFYYKLGLVFSSYNKEISNEYYDLAYNLLKTNKDINLEKKVEYARLVNKIEKTTDIEDNEYSKLFYSYLDIKNMVINSEVIDNEEINFMYEYKPNQIVDYLVLNLIKLSPDSEFTEILLFNISSIIHQLVSCEVLFKLYNKVFKKNTNSLLWGLIIDRIKYIQKKINNLDLDSYIYNESEIIFYNTIVDFMEKEKLLNVSSINCLLGLYYYKNEENDKALDYLLHLYLINDNSTVLAPAVIAAIKIYQSKKEFDRVCGLFKTIKKSSFLHPLDKVDVYCQFINFLIDNYEKSDISAINLEINDCKKIIENSRGYAIRKKRYDILDCQYKLYCKISDTYKMIEIVLELYSCCSNYAPSSYMENVIGYMNDTFKLIKDDDVYDLSIFDDLEAEFKFEGINKYSKIVSLISSKNIYEIPLLKGDSSFEFQVDMVKKGGFYGIDELCVAGTPIIGRYKNFYHMPFEVVKKDNDDYALKYINDPSILARYLLDFYSKYN